jgi:hypothetical protein
MRWRAILFLTFASCSSWAFPENVRHGYFSCTTCHVSPSGGGVLTPYGRSLSSELMSTWGTAKTSGFLFSDSEDEERNPPWFRAQALLRGVQTYRNTPKVEAAKFIPMQADLEAGVDVENFAVIVTGGARSNSQTQDLNEFFSRRHYVLYRFSDNWSARAGKFLFSFGLNMPDHITATRRGLGWDQGTESYNLEVNNQEEKILTTLTAITNSPEERSVKKDKGFAITSNYLLTDHSKAGLSLYSGEQETYRRWVFGPHWVLALTDKLFIDSEIFWQRKELKLTPAMRQNGYATFHRLGYEAMKGVTPFLQFDRSDLDDTDRTQRFDTYGFGVQWLPYPHFEFLSYFGKEKQANQDPTDFAWLMMNVYL